MWEAKKIVEFCGKSTRMDNFPSMGVISINFVIDLETCQEFPFSDHVFDCGLARYQIRVHNNCYGVSPVSKLNESVFSVVWS